MGQNKYENPDTVKHVDENLICEKDSIPDYLAMILKKKKSGP